VLYEETLFTVTNMPLYKTAVKVASPELAVFIQPVQQVIGNDFNTNQMILQTSCKPNTGTVRAKRSDVS
jgi:hypothetical protein